MASILLPVPQILQNPELPNGCEITSCCEVLHYLGFAPDKCELADYYLPRSAQWYGADPDEVYMGNPHLDDGSPETGYYCFAGPIVQAANEPFNLFSDGSRNFLLRPLIGIITKVDSPYANLPMVRQWMENMGCERIFEVNNVTREGISELMDYLKDDLPKLTLEQAKFKQSLGLNEWQPLPEGVEYPESIR